MKVHTFFYNFTVLNSMEKLHYCAKKINELIINQNINFNNVVLTFHFLGTSSFQNMSKKVPM